MGQQETMSVTLMKPWMMLNPEQLRRKAVERGCRDSQWPHGLDRM